MTKLPDTGLRRKLSTAPLYTEPTSIGYEFPVASEFHFIR